jgi:homoserine dehydrogenase
LELAASRQAQLRYSATVGAGTAFLELAKTLSRGDRIESVEGILNGTTNFILSAMQGSPARTYEDALAEAMRLGYAETDPSNDVDGFDTAMKLVILANHAMGAKATIGDVKIEGIRGVMLEQVEAARAKGMSIRLIGRITRDGDGVALTVGPRTVPVNGALDLPGTTNVTVFGTQTCGEVVLRGVGAGGPNTASAMLRDLVDIWLGCHGPSSGRAAAAV